MDRDGKKGAGIYESGNLMWIQIKIWCSWICIFYLILDKACLKQRGLRWHNYRTIF